MGTDVALQAAIDRLRERQQVQGVDYEAFHARRFDVLAALVERLAPPEGDPRILDVGYGPFTDRLRRRYRQVTTLGFPLDVREVQGRPHLPYDLNWTVDGRGVDTAERFDLIVFAEVIEHLHVPAEAVLPGLCGLLAPGGLLIVQTPNAAALGKRVALLLGLNPYERLRVDRFNPGHFREYTRAELASALAESGFDLVSHVYADYFPRPPARGTGLGRAVFNLMSLVVPEFREGQTLVARRR